LRSVFFVSNAILKCLFQILFSLGNCCIKSIHVCAANRQQKSNSNDNA